MNARALSNALCAQIQEELAARGRTLALIRTQERAVLDNDPAALEAAMASLEKDLEGHAGRARKRNYVIAAVAGFFDVAPESLTLASIIARFGDEAGSLTKLRDELNTITCDIRRANRRLAALCGMHRQIAREVITTILDEGAGDPLDRAGALVDAEA